MTTTTATEATHMNGGVESLEFTETDMGAIELIAEDLEGLESEMESLESISYEDVSEDLEAYFEGDAEEEGLERRQRRRRPSSTVTKRLLKTFVALVKKVVKNITDNGKVRPILQKACRKGPDAVAKLLCPILSKALPIYLRWMAPVFCRPVVRVLFRLICRQAGLTAKEMESVSEFAF